MVLDSLGNCLVVWTRVGDSGQWVVTMDTDGTYLILLLIPLKVFQ